MAEAAIIGTPHPETGESVLAFVAVSDPQLDEAALLEFCKAHLAGYKVPSSIEFMDELPKNTTGKLLRKNCANR